MNIRDGAFVYALLTSITFCLFRIAWSSGVCVKSINNQKHPLPTERRKYQFNALKFLPNGVKDGIASGIAATVAKGVLQPLDTIKTLQQANSMKVGPIRTGLNIVRERGVLSLWGGLGITVLGSAPSIAVYFSAYSTLRRNLAKVIPREFGLLNIAISSGIGNAIAATLRAPNEVIKQRIQTGAYSSVLQAIASIWKKDGPGGFFSNGKLTSQILRDVPYSIITLMTYETLQSVVKTQPFRNSTHIPLMRFSDVFCGAVAGGLGSFLTNPMDVAKTRMMTSNKYPTIANAFVRIAREEGLATFFSGSLLRLMHKIPANGIFFFCYEAFRDILGVERTTLQVRKK